jgi:hypothetical protein
MPRRRRDRNETEVYFKEMTEYFSKLMKDSKAHFQEA